MSKFANFLSGGWIMEEATDGSEAERLFYDTVREYVVSYIRFTA